MKKNEIKKGDGSVREYVLLGAIELDMSTQGRVVMDADVVSEYAGVLEAAWMRGEQDSIDKGEDHQSFDQEKFWPFPPVVLFVRDGRYWVGDGFHRVMGAHASEFEGVVADVYEGGVKDALRYALGANAAHGLRRSPADIKRCVELASMEFPEFSDRSIAKLVGCGAPAVGKYRPEGSRLGYSVAADGRVLGGGSGSNSKNGLPEGMDEPPVTEGAEGYVDDAEVRSVVVGVESGSVKSNGGLGSEAIMPYDVAYVCVNDRPGMAEVLPWVGADAPTYGELIMGSDVPVVRMWDEGGRAQNMVRRELVVAWCESVIDEVEAVDALSGITHVAQRKRWTGFRSRPVSLEHAERERERWLGEGRRAELGDWLVDLLGGLESDTVNLPSRLVVDEVRKLLPRESVELVDMAVRDFGADAVVDDMELVCLVLATALLGRGVDFVETELLGLVDADSDESDESDGDSGEGDLG